MKEDKYVFQNKGRGPGYGGVCADHFINCACFNHSTCDCWKPVVWFIQPNYLLLANLISGLSNKNEKTLHMGLFIFVKMEGSKYIIFQVDYKHCIFKLGYNIA